MFVSYSMLFDRNVPCYALVAFTSIFVYSNTFTADFVYDDSQAIVSNPVVTGDVPAVQAWSLDFWGHPLSRGSHKSYRPLTSLSFRLNAFIFGMKPLSFHATNVLLHAMASCLLLFFIQRFRFFSGNLESALFTALLFAVHPIHCEAVAGVVGRADVLVSIAVLVGVILYDKVQSTLVAAISTAIAICFKETGIVLPPLLVGFLLLKPVKNYMELRRSISGLFLVFLTLGTIRHSINSFEAPSFSKSDNPVAHHPSILTRTLTFLYLPVFHLQLLCYPKTLSFDWSMDAIPLVFSPLDIRFVASVACYLSLLLTGCALIQATGILEDLLRVVKPKKHEAGRKGCRLSRNSVAKCNDTKKFFRMTLLALSLLILPYIPSSNLFFYVGFMAAERILYLPSVGYCILVGMLYRFCCSRFGSKLAVSFGFLVLVLHGMRTHKRNVDWQNEESLYKSALEFNPPKAYSNLGRVYASQMRLNEAEVAYKNALAYRPNMADTWYNLGVLYQDMRNFSESIKCYRTSIKFRSTFATAHLNLGIVHETVGNDQSAISIWQLCSTMDGSLVKAQREHRNAQTSCRFRLGRMMLNQGNLHGAEKVLDEAIRKAPRSYPFIHSLLYSYGEVAKLLGNNDKAEQLFQAAFNAAPTHVPTLLTMAHLRNKQNRTSESNDWFSKALAVAPNSADVHHHIGLAAASRGDVARAEMAYKNALKLVSTHADSLKSLAALLREQHRYDKSEEVLRTLMNHHPTSETLSDYGAILRLNGKLDEAKRFYEKSLMLDPSNNVAKENLRRLERKLSSSTRHT
uniref:dolichyl-phosphate-mannose--protein mannosyltransferase n=1 Tax=Haemonchus contortus TaxID=6289 RepID=A0A7I4Y8E9_HAECO